MNKEEHVEKQKIIYSTMVHRTWERQLTWHQRLVRESCGQCMGHAYELQGHSHAHHRPEGWSGATLVQSQYSLIL
jgi:hypothetical protein